MRSLCLEEAIAAPTSEIFIWGSTNKLRQVRMRSNALKKQLLPKLSIDEKDIVLERDKKFVEENANLREIMKKLMEAGKGSQV